MLKYPSSLNGKIYLTEDTNEFYILDENGDFHPILEDWFNPLCDSLKHVYKLDDVNVDKDVVRYAKEVFQEHLLRFKLYTLIKKENIFNKII